MNDLEFKKCQSAFKNIVRLASKDTLKSTFVSEVLNTLRRCPATMQLLELEAGYKRILDQNYPEGSSAIMTSEVINKSLEQAAERAAAHYEDYTVTLCLRNLTIPNRIVYEIYERPDKLAVLATAFGLGILVQKNNRYLTSNTFIRQKMKESVKPK